VNVLFAMPLLPLAVAAWLALSPRASQLAGGWVVAIVAAIPFTVAMLASMERIDLPQLLVGRASALQLDETARAALLLFGGLWLTAGLLQTRARELRPNTILMLVALSGATTLALADGGPLVYAGMSMTGYGLCGILAGESVHAWRRAGRVLIVLLVISDLLVFEMLLASTAKPELGMQRGLLLLGLLALMLRAGVPPAHVWLPPALAFVTTPTAVLLVMAPAAALVGALKILPDGFPEIGMLCVLVGVAGAIWATIVGLVQVQARTTLAYALAATAAVLLMAVAAGAGAGGQLAWLGLAMLAACAALPLVALQYAGGLRDAAITAALVVHGLAGGHVALHATSVLPLGARLLAPLAALAATLLLTVTARRTSALAPGDGTVEPTQLAFAPVLLAWVGLALAWAAKPPGLSSTWVAPVAIAAGLIFVWALPRRAQPRVPPGDLLGPVERLLSYLSSWFRGAFSHRLPGARDRLQARTLALWDPDAWSRRIEGLDLRLRAWPATGVMMVLVALGAAILLTK
jgi:hypothetical protein